MRASTGLRLAALGRRTDELRIALTALGSAAATLALLAGATVAAIAPGDGPYTSELLNQGGLHPGVIAALWLLCVPVLVFVGQCSRVGAPARDRRLASFRMAGASPRQVVGVAAVESGLAAVAGSLLGLGVYLAGRQVFDRPVTGDVAFVGGDGAAAGPSLRLPTDVLPTWWVLLLVVALVPALATAGAALALRRTAITPFGVLRNHRTRPPRLLPVVLLLVGVGGTFLLGFLLAADVGGALTLLAIVVLLLCTISGLLLGTAAATRATGVLLASRVRSPALLIAAAEGLVERRRTLAALVAAGTPRGVIARAAVAESVLPLVVPVLAAAAAGTTVAFAVFGTTATTFDEVAQQSVEVAVPLPWLGLAVVVVGSLAAITAVTALALVFLRQATDLGELRAAA